MTWSDELKSNILAYSFIAIPVLLIVQFRSTLEYHLESRSPSLSRLLVWLAGEGSSSSQTTDPKFKQRITPLTNSFIASSQICDVYYKLLERFSSLPFTWRTSLRFIFCVTGLQVSFLSWGVLQERMVTQNYGNKRFTDSVFLVFANRCLAFLLGVVVSLFNDTIQMQNTVQSPTEREKYFDKKNSKAPAYKYLFAALSNIMATWFQYEALKFVSFPLQVLSKTCKIIATMLVGRCFLGKLFSITQYAVAISVTVGVTLFIFGNESLGNKTPNVPGQNSENTDPLHQLTIGIFLLLCYLIFDSFTSNWEEKLFHVYPKLSSYHMMAGINGWGTICTATALFFHGGFGEAFRFMFESGEFALHVFLLALASATGSLFIYYTISSFGAVVFASIMTIRQALAILLSCLIYGHVITPVGFSGLFLVFAALCVHIFTRKMKFGTETNEPDGKVQISFLGQRAGSPIKSQDQNVVIPLPSVIDQKNKKLNKEC